MIRILSLLALASAILLTSCSSDSKRFTISGRFLNMNQGELYIYSYNGATDGVDTIKVNGGRFAADIPCQRKGTVMMIFPNFSETPIFAEPGKSVDIKADASHLKEMSVKGTEDNELMTEFRQAILSQTPPQVVKTAENFVRDNTESQVAVYLIKKYFVGSGKPEYIHKGKELLGIVGKAQPKNGDVAKLKQSAAMLLASCKGNKLPTFSATSVNGQQISNATLKGKKCIICAWASWSYDSENMIRRINSLSNHYNVVAIGINVDASRKDCRNAMERNTLDIPVVCDEKLFESKLLATLGLNAVPDNIIIDAGGTVIARGVATDDIENYLR